MVIHPVPDTRVADGPLHDVPRTAVGEREYLDVAGQDHATFGPGCVEVYLVWI